MSHRLLVSLAVLLVTVAGAADIESLTVERDGKTLQVDSILLIDAPRELVYAVLADYDAFAELSDRYKQSRFVEPATDGALRIFTQVEGCVWFFCRSVERYSRLELTTNTKIIAVVEPEHSDFESGQEEWLLEDAAAGTRITYTHTMQPKFWIPPLAGVWAIRRTLEKDALSAAQKIEEYALRQSTDDSQISTDP
jgi:hypothetical protein